MSVIHSEHQHLVMIIRTLSLCVFINIFDLSVSDNDDTCHAQSKGDNSCAAHVSDDKYSETTNSASVISSGDSKWDDIDWKSYQLLDVLDIDKKVVEKRKYTVTKAVISQLLQNSCQ